MFWDGLTFFVLFFYCMYIPVEISFLFHLTTYQNSLIYLIIFLNIVLKLFTGFIREGDLVMERQFILKNYLEKSLFSDIIAIITILLSIIISKYDYSYKFSFIKLIFLIKLYECAEIKDKFIEAFRIEQKFENLMNLIMLVINCVIISHFFACAWYYVGALERNSEKNWLLSADIVNESRLYKYVYCYYWTTVTILTVGYGDISPRNLEETIFTIFVVIIGCFLYAFNLNNIGIITQKIYQKNKIYK